MPAGPDFPKMLYGPNATTLIVNSPKEQQDAGSDWKDTPSEEHKHPFKDFVSPMTPGNDVLIDEIIRRIAMVFDLPLKKGVDVANPQPIVGVKTNPPAASEAAKLGLEKTTLVQQPAPIPVVAKA